MPGMRRRDFVALLGVAAAWPKAVHAQPASLRRVGIFMDLSEHLAGPNEQASPHGLVSS